MRVDPNTTPLWLEHHMIILRRLDLMEERHATLQEQLIAANDRFIKHLAAAGTMEALK